MTGDVDWSRLARDRNQWRPLVGKAINLRGFHRVESNYRCLGGYQYIGGNFYPSPGEAMNMGGR